VIRLDCTGLMCPLPIVELAKAFPQVAVGEELELISDDPAAMVDVAAWCRLAGQELVSALPQPGDGGGAATAYRIRRIVVTRD
jgi:tRNA 2-thiouridine synthesizing protein A